MSGVIRYQHIDARRHDGLLLEDGTPLVTLRLSELRKMFAHLKPGPATTKAEILDLVLAAKGAST